MRQAGRDGERRRERERERGAERETERQRGRGRGGGGWQDRVAVGRIGRRLGGYGGGCLTYRVGSAG